jgi:uncharacterized protein YkwD
MKLRLTIVLVAAAVSLSGALGASAAPSKTALPDMARSVAFESNVLSALNEVRRANGLTALQLSVPLSRAAAQHNQEMAVRGYFEHSSADGTAFWQRIRRYYPVLSGRAWSVGENLAWIAYGQEANAAEAMRLWMASPEHRANILTARWREVGVAATVAASAPGVFNGSSVLLIGTDFGVRR